MIRYLTLELHHRVLEQSGGLAGVLDFGGLNSAVANCIQRRTRGMDASAQ